MIAVGSTPASSKTALLYRRPNASAVTGIPTCLPLMFAWSRVPSAASAARSVPVQSITRSAMSGSSCRTVITTGALPASYRGVATEKNGSPCGYSMMEIFTQSVFVALYSSTAATNCSWISILIVFSQVTSVTASQLAAPSVSEAAQPLRTSAEASATPVKPRARRRITDIVSCPFDLSVANATSRQVLWRKKRISFT